MSFNEDDSVEVRVDNVTTTSCDIFMEEPPSAAASPAYDADHALETISYVIMEEGEWLLEDDTVVKAGTVYTNKQHVKSGENTAETITFTNAFSASPVILHSLNTYNNNAFKATACKSVTASSFQIAQETAETSTSTEFEVISWIAIEAGKTGTIGAVKYETGTGNDGNNDGHDNDGHTFNFAQSFTTTPIIVTKQTTLNGGDGGWSRSFGTLTTTQHVTCTEEDQQLDDERSHTNEIFSFWAVEHAVSYDNSTSSSVEVEIIDNRFTVEVPSPQTGELCSIEKVKVNGTYYDFNYFISDTELFVTLLTSSLDGIYDSNNPITIEYGVSTSMRTSDQFTASFDFSQLAQDNYTFIGEFFDISGVISQFIFNASISIDFHGPQIYSQFINNCSINPESGSISFVVSDLSGVSSYSFNTSIDGYWTIIGDLYTYYFTDLAISEGETYFTFTCNDTQGLESQLEFMVYLDKSEPEFSEVQYLSSYWTDLFEINATITDFTGFSLSVDCLHTSSGTVVTNLDFTLVRKNNKWNVLLDSKGLTNGYYNITLTAIDGAGNSGSFTISNIYIDATVSSLDAFDELIYAGNDNLFNNTITGELFFNEEEYIWLTSSDQMFDGFTWNGIDQTLFEQQGVKNVTMYYTSQLSWQNISISGLLDYEQFHYTITGFGEPFNSDISLIRNIQGLKIGNYVIDKFEFLLDGTSRVLYIDPSYRYALSSQLTDQIEILFYEYDPLNSIVLNFNSTLNKWALFSSGKDYFNVSDYLTLSEGEKFLFWFEIEEGFGNVLLSHDYLGIFDNSIAKLGSETLYEWSLGTDLSDNGILIFGSDIYADSTIQINVSEVIVPVYADSDVGRILIYGTEDNQTWDYVGRAYFSGEES